MFAREQRVNVATNLEAVNIDTYNDDGQWLFRTEDASFWMMGNHKYALYCWMVGQEAGKEMQETTLVHVDKHFDYAVDSMIDDFLSNPSSTTALAQASYGLEPEHRMPQRKIMCDNFIPAAAGAGFFKRAIFVCRDDTHQLDTPANGRLLPHEIHMTFDSFQNMVRAGGLRSEKLCLDIDLDYFNDSDVYYGAALWEEKIIIDHLEFLRDLPSVVMTTVALSEPFSGGRKTAPNLLRLVKRVWGVTGNIEQSVDCRW